MNLVVVKHPTDSGKFLFRVPEDVTLDGGQMVMCDTARGLQPGICATPSFHADLDSIHKLWGCHNIKRIVTVLREFVLCWPEEAEDAEKQEEEEVLPFDD